MKVLVTGASGFIGRALVARLLADGCAVDAWDRLRGPDAPGLHRSAVDLTGSAPLPAPEGGPWDAAFHLAADSVPGGAWTHHAVIGNLTMTARVIDHLSRHAPGCRTIVASSGLVYAPGAKPHDEASPLGPTRPYGLSKQLCEDWALSARERLQVMIVRPFNQIGPGMAPGLLVPDVLERVARGDATLGMQGRDDWKDFLDWRDAMQAYSLLLRVDAPSGSVWNLCSGRPVRVSSLVRCILAECGVEREIRFADPAVESVLGDPSKLAAATGWKPRHELHETVRAICAHQGHSPAP